MIRKILIIATGLALVWGQVNKVASTTGQFLKLGVGSRAVAMGGGFVALADDGSAPYWNPAGILYANKLTTSFNHLDWALDIRKDYLSIITPMGKDQSIAFSLSALSMNEKPVTTVREPDGNGLTYGVLDLAIGLSLARHISDRLDYGLTAKTIYLSAYNETATGLALDLGSIMRTDFHDLKIGMSLSNFGGEVHYSGRDLLTKADIDPAIDGNYTSNADLKTESWPLPLQIRIGIAMDLVGTGHAVFPSQSTRLTTAIDAVHPNDGPEHINAGFELAWHDWLFLRSGYRFNYDEENWTIGGGLLWSVGGSGKWAINYAVVPFGVFGTTTQLSLDWILR